MKSPDFVWLGLSHGVVRTHCLRCIRARKRRYHAKRRRDTARIHDLVGWLRREKSLHLHWVRISDEFGWRVVMHGSAVCDDESRCLRLKVA